MPKTWSFRMRSEDNFKLLRRLIIIRMSTIRLLIIIFIRKGLTKVLSMINLGNKFNHLLTKRLATAAIKQLKARTLLKISTILSPAHFLRKR